MRNMTTHRLIQIHNMMDIAQSEVVANMRRAGQAASIGNKGARAYFLGRAAKFNQISVRCQLRLAV